MNDCKVFYNYDQLGMKNTNVNSHIEYSYIENVRVYLRTLNRNNKLFVNETSNRKREINLTKQ